MTEVSLFISLCKKDFNFIDHTIPHIIKGCNYPFKQIILLVDQSKAKGLHGKFEKFISSKKFFNQCEALAGQLKNAIVLEINYSRKKEEEITKKYFGRPVYTIKDFRGNLLYGFIFGIESSLTDYVVHFDSDILIHSDIQYSWIKEGLDLLDKYDDIISVSPLSGPPRKDKNLIQDKNVDWVFDERGFYKFQNFTTRLFMIKKSKMFNNLLPLPIKHVSWKKYLWSLVSGHSSIWALEWLIAFQLKQLKFYRADIASGKSWMLYTSDHGEKFCKYLPAIIKDVENNRFPIENSGKYDLDLEAFVKLIDSEKTE